MNLKSFAFGGMVVALIALSMPAMAHHGNASFDTSKRMTVKGNVVGWVWANPHCILTFDAKDEKGNPVRWAAEATVPSDMAKRGWSRNMFTPGDEVSVTLTPAKNGSHVGRIEQVVLPNGQTLTSQIPPDSPTESKP
jgi:hypothetical protein